MATSITIPAADPRVISMAAQSFKPVYEYENGKKTESQKRDDSGKPIFRLKEQAATVAGESVIVDLQSQTQQEIQAGAVLVPKTNAALSIRATATGNGFAKLDFTLSADEWVEIGSIFQKGEAE